ncbi:hypothetical protein ACNH6C_09870 [Bdellovibrio bacteriovorus]|uniref:hypothetical protein n=1 Tax=Bdellovibrio bacteriovorus TaxID=959 RepID=UPI003A7F9626
MKNNHRTFELLEGALGQKIQLKGLMLPGVPVYISQAFSSHQLGVGEPEQYQLLLLTPKRELAFEQIMNALRFVRRLNARIIPVLIADDVNPKFRPLLVREKVPFLYKDKTIFIPEVGLKGDIGKMMRMRAKQGLGLKDAQFELKPLALKVIAGYLTDQVPAVFSQGNLFDQIKSKAGVSRTKFSEAIRDLVRAELLVSNGLGPKKEYKFAPKQQVWAAVGKIPMGKLFRVVEVDQAPKAKGDYVFAGETALSDFSNLAEPKKKTIAVTSAVFKDLKNSDQIHGGHSGVIIQVWKEDPKLFSIRNNLNPVELYFSLKHEFDDRVQIALQEMLREYGIEMESK